MMTSKIPIILLGLIFYIHLSKCWIIVEDANEVEVLYFQLRYLFTGKMHPIYPINDDKFSTKTPREFNNICSQLKNSNIYKRVSIVLPPLPTPTNLNKIPDEAITEELTYTLRPLKSYLARKDEQIPAFPCQTHVNKIYWLTYGYADDQIFLLQEVGDAVSFIAIAQSTPQINTEYTRGEALDDYFLKAIQQKTTRSLGDIDSSPSLLQFCLCCLVHEARLEAHPEKESFTLNYGAEDLYSIIKPCELKFHHPEKHEKTKIEALGCAINRYRSEIGFYLQADSQNPYAVFVFEETEEKTLNVVEHVHKLPFKSTSAIYAVSEFLLSSEYATSSQ